MKKKKLITIISMSLILLLIIVGCSDNNEVEDVDTDIADENLEDNELKEDDDEEDESQRIMEEFREMAENSPDPDVLVEFMDENIDKISAIDADEMINALEVSLEENRRDYQDRISELDKENELMDIAGDKIVFDSSSIEDIENEDLKEEVNELYSNMYKLQNIEGGFYPVIDYAKLKTYDNYITEEWKEYLMIKSLEAEDRAMSDGSLNISFNELADRILKTENYLNKYINGARHEEMLKNYENKINAYLKGLPNTEIKDSDTGKIKDEVLESYKEVANKENYMTTHTVYEYLEAIKGNDYIIDESILEKADELIEEALRMLREFK